MEGKGYSIWLRFNTDYESLVQDRINHLSSMHGTICFEPHMTLLGTILKPEEEILALTNDLTQGLTSFSIKSEGVLHSAEYFRSVFIKAVESEELLRLSDIARKIFSWPKESPPYFPHVSLIYGSVAEAERKNIADSIPQALINHQAKVTSIEVWKTTGAVNEWKNIAQLKLGAK